MSCCGDDNCKVVRCGVIVFVYACVCMHVCAGVQQLQVLEYFASPGAEHPERAAKRSGSLEQLVRPARNHQQLQKKTNRMHAR